MAGGRGGGDGVCVGGGGGSVFCVGGGGLVGRDCVRNIGK